MTLPSASALRAHGAAFRKGVVELGGDAHLVVGHAVSNVGIVIGPRGVVVIDTTEGLEAAQAVHAELRRLTPKPVKAVILTHGHRDHVGGVSVFAGPRTPVIAAHAFNPDLAGAGPGVPVKELTRRARRQFGMGLQPGTERINLGIGPGERPLGGLGQGYRPPTRRVPPAGQELVLAGVRMRLLPVPGETADHMAVWLPEARVLFGGDNYYQALPNLYAIRGTRYRDFSLWARSLERLIELRPRAYAPGHTQPLFGVARIKGILGDYRDAIDAIVTQCRELVDAGCGPDELAARVRLPAALAAKPHLQEFYGTVAWAARAYYGGEIGWFDGNPTNLFPLGTRDHARRLARLAGGKAGLGAQLDTAVLGRDWQWVLELADILDVLGHRPAHIRAERIKALRALGGRAGNAPARNYYLSCARELEGDAAATGNKGGTRHG